MKNICLIFVLAFFVSCNETNSQTNKKETVNDLKSSEVIPVLALDKEALSGIGLKAVKNNNQPDRRLYQKRLMRGQDLSVYVVSSETASAQQENYVMEEFISLINGRSRMNPKEGEEVIFETGQSFIAPKGFTGEWETIGGDEFLIELSIITTNRVPVSNKIPIEKTIPVLLDGREKSGNLNGKTKNYELYNGIELNVRLVNEDPGVHEISEPMKEQVVEVLSGIIDITPKGGEMKRFITGDYFMLPKGFTGTFASQAHGKFRTMVIQKADTKL